MQDRLVINDRLSIPRGELRFTFVRSSGPGGQNVNKVNTKAVMRWGVADSPSLPPAVRARLIELFGPRINDSGELVLSSDRYREQGRNVSDCLERLRALVAAAAEPRKRRVATRPSRASKERRLQQKRSQSDKKSRRRFKPEE